MSENIIPEEIREASADVEKKIGDVADKIEGLADKSLSELSDMFVELKESAERMSRSKEAEAIKSAFYKLLGRLKGENGVSDETASSQDNPFEAVEQNFKALYADYKKERAEFNKEQDARREENLAKKQAVIEELKALVEGQDDVSAQFPAFRELQNRWREAGPVPATAFRDINDTYQFYVEKFYDMVKINRDLRDLDFRKNLEAKEAFCEAAETLSENENVVSAFHELQKLHEQWKEYGPVAKEKREDIWNRFKAATAVINKRYQAHFEGLKEQQADNLTKKTELCEKTEEIAAREITNTAGWNAASKEIEEIQAAWRKIGYATKKDNQKIYDRFRAACDAFFTRKREFYSGIKDNMNDNLEKKLSLIEQAEALKSSTEWKKATDQFIALQKQWKEIGAVPRKKSEALWKRFRAACDEYFAARDANAGGENDFYGNLRAKRKVVEDIQAYEPAADAAANGEAMRAFQERWSAIGHVPFKEKDAVGRAYRDAMQAKFPEFGASRGASAHSGRAPRNPKDALIEKYNKLQQNITTYENNIGFFSASKNSEPLIKQMEERIEQAKAELKELEAQIRKAEEGEA
jgi:DNA repair exonuclease SbcCD ATPase subunit